MSASLLLLPILVLAIGIPLARLRYLRRQMHAARHQANPDSTTKPHPNAQSRQPQPKAEGVTIECTDYEVVKRDGQPQA